MGQTTNYNLTKPDIGSIDWGEDVNTNFDTIDTRMKANADAASSAQATADEASVTTLAFDNDDLVAGTLSVAGEHSVVAIRNDSDYVVFPDEIYYDSGNTIIDITSYGTITTTGSWEIDYL